MQEIYTGTGTKIIFLFLSKLFYLGGGYTLGTVWWKMKVNYRDQTDVSFQLIQLPIFPIIINGQI